MKGIQHVINESKKGKTPLYYSFDEQKVFTEPGEGRYFVTYLIRENTADEIKKTIEWWKRL